MNYTLEVNSSLNQAEILASVTVHELEPNTEYVTLGGNLSNENTLYSFRILVANDVGIVSTSYRPICKSFYCTSSFINALFHINYADTTDVQAVKVTLIEGANASTIQCEFITGSNATGCMVVLTGLVPYQVYLTRNPSANLTAKTVTLAHPPSCYTGVEAFDIESDGSVGSLAVPGRLGGRLETPCTPNETLSGKSILITCIVVH
jgi:hypothetical protein